MSQSLRVDEKEEADRIDALEAALDALDPGANDDDARAVRDRLYSDLFSARSKRIERRNEETWRQLEVLLGRKLRR